MSNLALAGIIIIFSWLLFFLIGLAVGYGEGLKENSEVNEFPKGTEK